MLMADTMAIFFVILGLMLAFPGLWLLCRGLWPDTVAEAAKRCGDSLFLSFLAGLPVTVMMLGAAVVLNNLFGPVGKAGAIGIVSVYMVLAHTGVAGLATCIGRRLTSPSDEERPWRATLRGGIVLELSYLLPILGWFVILPASIITGCGAATLSLLTFKKASSPVATTPAQLYSPTPTTSEVAGFQVGSSAGAPR